VGRGTWEYCPLGNARAIFLSADNTKCRREIRAPSLKLIEAQDVDKEKYSKDFKPMGSTTNVTTVLMHYLDDATLLEEVKQSNLEMERKDGICRHFRYDWQEVAKYNPDYLAYVEGEKQRLGENHPLFSPSIACSRCAVVAAFSLRSKRLSCRVSMPVNISLSAEKYMLPVLTWRAKPRNQ